ncbi:putative transmembrane protein [Leptomonas seymouri]|uniref:Putative transmembrane protein n=1 Tax=Leptomonas seymouri TaxID=5684 RepID=A0A0N1I5I2_LEPSE|nr:putative transmembrane protein [Leptomonas seymouri]|eukprot:KPI87044.1 putative transmembrane protein [Leptomonas seymouri]
MLLYTCVVEPSILLMPSALIFLYFGGVTVSLVNTAEFFQKRNDVYPSALIAAHLSFCVIGTVAFFCVSSVFWLWSAKYSLTHAERMWRLCVGLWFVFFFKDLPLLIIETHANWLVGWQNGNFMDVSFILQIIFFVPSSLASSATISWYIAGFLERQFGDAMQVALQEKEDPRRVSPEVAAQLAVASVLHPPLPLQEMHYSTTHPPRIYPSSHPYNRSTIPSFLRQPLSASAPINYVAADYNNDFVLNQGGVHVRLPGGELRFVESEEDSAPYPAVI